MGTDKADRKSGMGTFKKHDSLSNPLRSVNRNVEECLNRKKATFFKSANKVQCKTFSAYSR